MHNVRAFGLRATDRSQDTGSPIMTAPTKADTANEVVAWYAMPVDEVVKTLATGIQKGLSATEASSRLEKCGPTVSRKERSAGHSCASSLSSTIFWFLFCLVPASSSSC